ncbi:MAG TPA: response regulator [Polyangia bacterium]|nr:response regulator [Polyangia bacterium]
MSASRTGPEHTNGKVVLIVDDDRDIAESIADVLRARGRRVVVALDGQGALDAAHGHAVALVLLDWRLPDAMAGATLVRRLRESCGPSVPVVVLSADPMSLAEAREAQVNDYLPKPFEVGDLLDLVDNLTD